MACSLVAENIVSDSFSMLPSHSGSSAGSTLRSLASGQPEPEQSYESESSSGYALRVQVPGSWIDDLDVDVDEELETISDGSVASDDTDREAPQIEETPLEIDEQEPPSPIILTVTPNDDSSGTLVCNSSSTESPSVSPTSDSKSTTGISCTKPESIRSLDSEPDNHTHEQSLSVPALELEVPEVEPEFLPHVERERWPRASSLDTGLAGIQVGDSITSVTERRLESRQSSSLRVRPATSPSSRVTNPTATGPDGAISIWQTSYRPSPLRARIPPESVRVRIWAVAVDGVDGRLAGSIGSSVGGSSTKFEEIEEEEDGDGESELGKERDGGRNGPLQGTSRNPFMALSRTLSVHLGKRKKEGSQSQENLKGVRRDKQTRANAKSGGDSNLKPKGKIKLEPRPPTTGSTFREAAPYIPGRSFVGQVEEVGVFVDQRDRDKPSGLRRGEWVVGLVGVRKSGALAEFIIVDWRRVHRVPKEYIAFPSVDHIDEVTHPTSPSSPSTHEQSMEEESDNGQRERKEDRRTLTLDELALLPLCGIPAYRAVSTFLEAFVDDHEFDYTEEPSDSQDEIDTSSHDDTPTQSRPYPSIQAQRRRRALILRGTDGAGALAAQMLIRLGWRVTVHAPFSRVPENATQGLADAYMCSVEDQARNWGADEVIFDDAEAERTGDGGWKTREAIVRVMETIRVDGDVFDAVLDTVGGKEIRETSERLLSLNKDMGQFTTLVGDNPELAIPTMDNGGKEGCACVSLAQEDEPVFEMLGPILSLAIKAGVRPVVEDPSGETFGRGTRVVAFDRAFVNNRNAWWLANGGTLVIRLVA